VPDPRLVFLMDLIYLSKTPYKVDIISYFIEKEVGGL
jgi:hypothetical protein